ncbi:MAG: hypothetical protein Q9162_007503 [Coniocarpon cinnabarinum]
MATNPQSQSSDWDQYTAAPALNGSCDGSDLLLTSPLDNPPTGQYSPHSAFVDISSPTNTANQQQLQYGPVFQHSDNSTGNATNRQQFSQHPMQAISAQQFSRPGTQLNQLQAVQQPQQLAQAAAYMPHDISSSQFMMLPQDLAMRRNFLHQQLDINLGFAPSMGQALLLNLPAATPIERSQSDIGPQTSAHSFSLDHDSTSNNGQRPCSSRSMGEFHPSSAWNQRPVTPSQQMSMPMSEASTSFQPVTPSHQVQSEAVDLSAPSTSSPRDSTVIRKHGNGAAGIATHSRNKSGTPSVRTSKRASVDISSQQSPSKTIGPSFENLSVTDPNSQDIDMVDDLFMDDSLSDIMSGNHASPIDSENDAFVIDLRADSIEEGLPAYLVNEKQGINPFKCQWPGCNYRCKRHENAKNHVQTHFQYRPWACSHCATTFARQHDCKRHVRIHNPDRKHHCGCNFAASRLDALRRHQERVTCEYMRKQRPDFVKPPTKRGRPKKDRAVGTDVGRVSKSVSPKKGARARHQKNVSVASAALQSPTPQRAQIPQAAPLYGPVDQASFGFVDQSHMTGSQNDPPVAGQQSSIDLSSQLSTGAASQALSAADSPQMNGVEGGMTYDYFSSTESSMPAMHVNPQMLNNSVMLSNNPSTPPMSPTVSYSTGWNSPAKQDLHTPPGSPPGLSNSPAASSMGEELPSAAYGDQFENGDFADLLGPIGDFNKANDPLWAMEPESPS